jgi:hypothetical protein
MRPSTPLLAALAVTALTGGPALADDRPGVAVVELFTSEGCSSCPPAESLLNALDVESRRSGARVYALAFHVDYWNYLGWIDRFSTKAFAERQRVYGQALEGGRVYTPQMVVNGRVAFVGSSRARARAAVAAALDRGAQVEVDVEARREGRVARATVNAKGAPADATVHVALVANDLRSDVTSGENRGRRLVHRGVVRALRSVRASALPAAVSFELPDDVKPEQLEVVAFVQARSLEVAGADRAALSR